MGEESNNTRQFVGQISSHRNNNNNNKKAIFTNENFSAPGPATTVTNTAAAAATEDRFPEYWRELRQQKQFFDGVIMLPSGSSRPIHRIVLSACSQYFKATFTYNSEANQSPLGKKRNAKCVKSVAMTHIGDGHMHHSNADITQISLDVYDGIMEAILDYAYTGECTIDWSNVEELLRTADRYQITGIVRLCCAFLGQQLNAANCIGIYLFAKSYFCGELELQAKRFILRHFVDVRAKSVELRQLEGSELRCILSDERLNVCSEMIVLDAVREWIEFEPQQRLKWFGELLPCIRAGLLDGNAFRQKLCGWKCLTDSMNLETIAIPMYCKPRIPNQVIMVVGGWIPGEPTNMIEVYDQRADLWLELRHTDSVRAYHGVCSIDHQVYVIGGFNGFVYYNSMRCYDSVQYKWEEKACMYHARCYVSVAVLDGQIYALGGFDGYTRLNSVERYIPDKNQWEIIAPMKRSRSDAAAVAFRNHIYVVGGFNGSEVLKSCEVYDKEANCWTLIASMLSPRSGVGLAACNGYLYAMGGYSGHARLRSVERFSRKHAKWISVAKMMSARSNFATAVLGGVIFVIGGYNGSNQISFVEQYDTTLNTWKAATQMNYNRSAPAACVLRDLPNMHAYSLQCFEMCDATRPCFLSSESKVNARRLQKWAVRIESAAANAEQLISGLNAVEGTEE